MFLNPLAIKKPNHNNPQHLNVLIQSNKLILSNSVFSAFFSTWKQIHYVKPNQGFFVLL